MISTASHTLRRLRIAALALGALMLFWLPVEDLDERWVLLFAAAISALGAARASTVLRSRPVDRWRSKYPILFYLSICALAGLAVSPLAVLLMALKSGLHGHPAPDYTPEQVLSVLRRTPFWVLGGLLIGVGVGLLESRR